MNKIAAFVRSHTAQTVLPFLPELSLALGNDMNALWKEIEKETGDPDCSPPFWAFAWPGGQGLARYLIDHPETVRGKKVLDFASGSGLVGLAAAQAGAQKVYVCDIDPYAQEAAKINAATNGVVLEGMEISNPQKHAKGVDIVLAGDVFYDHLMAHRTLAWLKICVHAGQTVLFGDPGRAYVPQEGTQELEAYLVPTLLDLEDREERTVKIFRLLDKEKAPFE